MREIYLATEADDTIAALKELGNGLAEKLEEIKEKKQVLDTNWDG